MLNKLGIIQGRLLPPVDNNIQEFPKKNWKKEFDIINKLNLKHIEWVITKKSFKEGVLDLNVKKYSNKISSICCDNLIDKKITCKKFLYEQLKPICEWAIKNDIKVIGIPLLEESEINVFNVSKFKDLIKSYGDVYHNLEFHFEIEASSYIALQIISQNDNFFLTYDTGNITSYGLSHKDYLERVFPYIKNIHLKDRTKQPIQTVEPGTGDTDFAEIFDILKKNNYNSMFTLQTARGLEGEELKTIKKHIEFYEKFI